MGTFFRETNNETAAELFDKKNIYNSMVRDNSPNLINFQFAEKALYGRVDRAYLPIVPNDIILQLKGFGADGTQNQGHRALNFVSDAFAALRTQFMKKKLTNEISPNEEFLSNPIVYKAYESPKKQYNDFVEIYLEAFADIAKSQRLEFTTFQEFVDVVMPYLLKTVRKKPFTYTAFVKSTFCSINASGLVGEIADLYHENDEEKIAKFIESPNWEYYLNVCGNHGFMVDRNCPWRLVADIGSAQMLQYAEPYGVLTTDQVLNLGYNKAHKNAIKNFRNVLYRMYMKLKKPKYYRYSEIDQQGNKIEVRETRMYTAETYQKEYPDTYFIKLYCQLRFKEEESQFSESEKFQITDNAMEMAAENVSTSINMFEIIVNKTFDYRGSLSYTKKTIAAKRI